MINNTRNNRKPLSLLAINSNKNTMLILFHTYLVNNRDKTKKCYILNLNNLWLIYLNRLLPHIRSTTQDATDTDTQTHNKTIRCHPGTGRECQYQLEIRQGDLPETAFQPEGSGWIPWHFEFRSWWGGRGVVVVVVRGVGVVGRIRALDSATWTQLGVRPWITSVVGMLLVFASRRPSLCRSGCCDSRLDVRPS